MWETRSVFQATAENANRAFIFASGCSELKLCLGVFRGRGSVHRLQRPDLIGLQLPCLGGPFL
jgi:hypothetical protein